VHTPHQYPGLPEKSRDDIFSELTIAGVPCRTVWATGC
jgi:hypothetical protein